MKEQRRNHDPYERGFADKLYESYIGTPPTAPHERPPQQRRPAPRRVRKSHPKAYRPYRKVRYIFLSLLMLVVLAVVLVVFVLGDQPVFESYGHLSDSSTILLAGTDESGLNTDTLMLINCNRSTGQISVMSIPRDTKVDSTYWPHKINGAYNANGQGKEGMYWLCDYVRQCVGFMPDGYVLVDLDCFMEVVDLFGGVDYDVPMSMHYEDPVQDLYIHLEPGMQHLNGEQAMGLVRFRYGYTFQDLDRVKVQRDFLMKALKQWMKMENVSKASAVLDIMERYCITDLSRSNMMWLAKSLLICGTDDMMMTTVPSYVEDMYVCIRCDDAYLDLINTYFNPYEKKVTYGDLNIAD